LPSNTHLIEYNNSDLNNGNISSNLIKRHSCEDIDECQSIKTHHCSQKCINLKGTYKCMCDKDYIDLNGDGNICEAPNDDNTIFLFSLGSEIRRLGKSLSNYNSIIQDQSMVIALDIDPINRHLYWIEEDKMEIKRTFIPLSITANGHEQVLKNMALLNDEMIKYTAISIDWINKNLYYAECTKSTIRVSKTDGRYSKTLISVKAQLVYSMIVNPTIGYK
jgi:hypothetical protein